jgi:hypothetical protein
MKQASHRLTEIPAHLGKEWQRRREQMIIETSLASVQTPL